MDWCKRVVFTTPLPPCSVTRLDIHFDVIDSRPAPTTHPEHYKIKIATAHGQVVISCRTGHIESYVVDGKEFVKSARLR